MRLPLRDGLVDFRVKISLPTLFVWLLIHGSLHAQGTVGGLLSADQTLTLADSPWRVTSTIEVPTGVTLTVEAGVRVDFDDGTGIEVDGGKMVADGTAPAPIVFGRADGEDHTWDGFIFKDTYEDNRLTHFAMEYGDDVGHSIEVDKARLTIQFGSWPTTEETMIEMDEPAVIIEDSDIPGISGGEVIHGVDLVAPGHLILRRNTFGKASNGGDVIDFSRAEAPGPILQIIDNIFMGGDDDGLDLDGTDCYVEGNVFMDFRKDPANTRATTSNAVATGLPQNGDPNRTRVTMVRNLFLNCDHAILLKEEAFVTAVNNTFIGMEEAVIQFNEEGGTSVEGPGKGAILDGNIFWDNVQLFKHLIEETELTIDRCIIDSEFHDRGVDNFMADPGFADMAAGDYTLIEGSPAIGTGPNGLDRGHLVPEGASISGEPRAVTWQTDAALIVGGPGIVNYRYRLNGGAWSVDTPVGDPIFLTGLNSLNSVEVVGQNAIGEWQADSDATESETWRIDTDFGAISLNEIDAANGKVEIWNDTENVQDLSDYNVNGVALTNATAVQPGGFAVVDVPNLSSNGGEVNLILDGIVIADSVTYGIQIPGTTIARFGRERRTGDWAAAKPTIGARNIRQPTALSRGLKLNEWLLNPDCLFTFQFVELYNPEGLPISLEGMEVDIEPSNGDWFGAPLSFIAANGFTAIISDGDLDAGANHANFGALGDIGSEISLFGASSRIDVVANNTDTPDVSGGFTQLGGDVLRTFALPTPGFAVTVREVETVTPLVAIDDEWAYEDTDTDLGTDWRETIFDFSAWPKGEGLLGRETSDDSLTLTVATEINYVEGIPTYYFRHADAFTFSGDPSTTQLRLRTVVDDGVVVYLNGAELHRLRMDDPVTHASFASDNIGNADYEGPFDLPSTALVAGENFVAAEVHQDDDGSSDIVFGLELAAVETEFVTEGLGDATAILAGLRLTEIMYHPAAGGVEYLEFQNTGLVAFDLGGTQIVEGVEFRFPPHDLAPGEFVYVVASQAGFGRPDLMVAGEFSGTLDDDGERIRVELDFGAGVVDVTYSDGIAVGTDGGGNSLELSIDRGLKSSGWVSSPVAGGTLDDRTPFEDYSAWLPSFFDAGEIADELISGPQADPDGDGLVNLLERLLGRNPKLADAVGALALSLDGDDLVLRYTRAVSVGDGELRLTMSTDLTSWSEIPGLTAAVVSGDQDEQVIEARVPAGVLERKFVRLEGIQD